MKAKTFEVTSGTIVASDPCYEIPTWCQGVIEKVKKGTWEAHIEKSDEGDWGVRIAVLRINHINHSNRQFSMEGLDIHAGVDSGQFGFFDKDFFRNDEKAKELVKEHFSENWDSKEGDSWYRACCKLTLSPEGWGVLPQGAVSSSGFGDGSYGVYGEQDAYGEWIAFEVVYIDDEADDEDEEDEEESVEF
jgi:hypothetical protein